MYINSTINRFYISRRQCSFCHTSITFKSFKHTKIPILKAKYKTRLRHCTAKNTKTQTHHDLVKLFVILYNPISLVERLY